MRRLLPLFLSAAGLLAQPAGGDVQRAEFERGERALAEGRYAEAEASYQRLAALNPALAEAHARLGLVYFQEKKFAKAVPALRRSLKLKPGLANTDVLLAMSLSELGQYEEALAGLEKGFKRSSDPVLKRMSGLELARAYTGLRRDRDAVEVALELERLYPKDPEVLYHAGKLFGNFAYLTMQRLGDVAPGSVWRHQAAGEAHQSQGDYDFAILEYREALKLDPSRPGIHYRIGRSLLLRGTQTNARAEDAEEAAKEFELELQIDPDNANAAYELGEIARKAGQLEKARQMFEGAVGRVPGFEVAQIGLGRTLAALGKPDLAVPHLQQAVALNPNNEASYYHLAQAYGALGKAAERDEALARFQRLRQKKSGTPDPVRGPDPVTPQDAGEADVR